MQKVSCIAFAVAGVVLVGAGSASAAVTISGSLSAPANPVISFTQTTTSSTTVRNSASTPNNGRDLGNAFTPADSFQLDSITVRVPTEVTSATTLGQAVQIELFQIGAGPTFTTVAGFSTPFANLPNSIPANTFLTFDLTGTDEVNLVAGTQYGFLLGFVDAPTSGSRELALAVKDNTAGITNPQVNGEIRRTFTTATRSGTPFFNTGTNIRAYEFFVTAVPEPSSLGLVAAGGLLTLGRRRRA